MHWTKLLFTVVVFLAGTILLPAATIYVDDDAPSDPGPGDPTISDPAEDGSQEHPYDSVVEAVKSAAEGDMVLVEDGNYGLTTSGLSFGGTNIALSSINGPKNCILTCEGQEGISFNQGLTRQTVLRGFTVTGYKTDDVYGEHGAIKIWDCDPTIQNCIVINNQKDAIYLYYGAGPLIENCLLTDCSGGVVGSMDGAVIRHCEIRHNLGVGIMLDGSTLVENCLIVENSTYHDHAWGILIYNASTRDVIIRNCTIACQFGQTAKGIAISGRKYSPILIENCIVWDNPTEIEIGSGSSVNLQVRYSNIHRGWPGEGNISVYPQFVKEGYWDNGGTITNLNDDTYIAGDYHLLGMSPCVDSGDPDYVFSEDDKDMDGKPRVLYGRIDMGSDEAIVCDNTGDKIVDLRDFGAISQYWLGGECVDPSWCGKADLSLDGTVGQEDLFLLLDRWLTGAPSLVGYWRMDRNFQDSVGVHDGTKRWYPSFTLTAEAKMGRSALNLDGDDMLLMEGYKGISGSAQRTCMAWIKTTVPSGDIFGSSE